MYFTNSNHPNKKQKKYWICLLKRIYLGLNLVCWDESKARVGTVSDDKSQSCNAHVCYQCTLGLPHSPQAVDEDKGVEGL